MKKLSSILKKNLPLIIFFLFSIPNLSLPIPLIKTTHIFTSLLIFVCFFKFYKRNKIGIEKILLLVFLWAMSISIINLLNIISFLLFFKNIIIGFIYFLILETYFSEKQNIKNFLRILILSMVINSIYAIIIYASISNSSSLISSIIAPSYISSITKRQIYLNKYFIELNSFYFLPILFVIFVITKRKMLSLVSYVVATTYLVLSYLSNYRILLVIVLISFSFLFFYLFKFIRKFEIKFLPFLITLVITFYFYQFVPKNTISRIINPELEDSNSIVTRVDFIQQSIDIFKSSILFGVGLGNFYEHMDQSKLRRIINPEFKNLYTITNNEPHNIVFQILAETGVIGFLSSVVILLYWIKKDLLGITSNNHKDGTIKLMYTGVVLSFYLQIIFALTTPFYTVNNLISFFACRALLNGISNIRNHFVFA